MGDLRGSSLRRGNAKRIERVVGKQGEENPFGSRRMEKSDIRGYARRLLGLLRIMYIFI